MPGVDEGIFFPVKKLREWSEQVFRKAGVPHDDSILLADSLITANLRGVDTHGITRMLPVYINRIKNGVMNPETKLTVLRERLSTALIDCSNGPGQIGSDYAMNMAIEKASKTGTAFVATTHSNHFGAGAYWAMKALEHGMIGFAATNAPAVFAPTGGKKAMLGTNPFAVAIPAGNEMPFVLDLATTVVARGRVMLHKKQNIPLQPGWAFDESGRPTTDPVEAVKGLLAPIGGYKGYGIALAIDIMSGVMTGSNYGSHFPGFPDINMEEPSDIGGIFCAVSIDSFMDLSEFTERMDTALREIKNCPLAEGNERIYIPGEIEMGTYEKRIHEGIPLPEVVVGEFENIGEEMGVPF